MIANQTVLVVGASAGIGLATAEAAAREGARVVMVGRDQKRLEKAARGLSAQPLAVDMLDRAAVERATQGLGEIHHLVLSAAGDEYGLFGPLPKLSERHVEESFDKLRGFINFIAIATPTKSLTLVSGAGAARPPKETALAAVANAGAVALAKAMAVDLAPVRSNVVMPGVVETGRHGDKLEDLRKFAETELPARRFGQPSDIADAIVFLMKNPYMTGHTLVIDGGFLLQ